MTQQASDRRGERRGPAPRRTSLSLEAIVSEAVAILDEYGESALTFRVLAQRLGGGLGSIYWYVAGKEELLDRATDSVLADVLVATEGFTDDDDPIADVRSIAVTLFDTVAARPWLASYFLRDTGMQPNGLLLYERVGQQVLRLGLDAQATFDSVSAVLGYLIGVAADLAQEPPESILQGLTTREAYMHDVTQRWRALDPARFPFLHTIIDVFEVHDDAAQFRAGLDMLLDGLRLKAGRGGGPSTGSETAGPAHPDDLAVRRTARDR